MLPSVSTANNRSQLKIILTLPLPLPKSHPVKITIALYSLMMRRPSPPLADDVPPHPHHALPRSEINEP
jgi:hypothetical protein